MSDESALVARVLDGDEDAFTEILRLHQGRVRAYLGRYSRDDDVVDDLAQDVFLRAYRTMHTYRGESRLSTWLIGTARHVALTYLRDEARRQKRIANRFRTALSEWRLGLAESATAGDDRAEGQIAALAKCVGELPESSADLVDRHYFRGEAIEAIGRSLGRKGSTLRMAFLRIREALRKCVELRLSGQEG
jgi:RNA polymerase sigma-70 factor (ECF subfamily)